MGRLWDILFHWNKYNTIVSNYDTLIQQCYRGINIFLKQNKRDWSESYEFKKYIYQNAEDIRKLQKEYDQEEQRIQEIKDRSESIKEYYKYGFDYYHFRENLKRAKPSIVLEMISSRKNAKKSKLGISFTPTPEQICNDFGYIKKYERTILDLIKLKKNCPEGYVICAKAHKVDPSTTLEPPYDFTSFSLINIMTDYYQVVKSHQEIYDIYNNDPFSVLLDIEPNKKDDFSYMPEEIKQAEQDYRDLCELREQNPELLDYIIRIFCKDSIIKIEELGLDAIRQILKYMQLFKGNDVRESEYFLSLSDFQRKYILSLPSPMLQKEYLINTFFRTKTNAIVSAEPEDCNSVVKDYLKNCNGIDIENVTYDTYFTTVSKLLKGNHSIYSALSLINRQRRIVELFYKIDKDAALPFSVLTDVYYDNSLSQTINKEEIYRNDFEKAKLIMLSNPLGYQSLLAQGKINDILQISKPSHNELKWIIANENIIKSEQAAKKLEEKINHAKKIISSNSEAVSRLMPGVSCYSLTSVQADKVIRDESNLSTLTRILKKVASWEKTKGIPHYFFYWYYPTKFLIVSSESQSARKLIWNFKDGCSHDKVIDIVTQKLESTFGSDSSLLTLVCIPASSVLKNELRYKDFARIVCDRLKMTNAFDKIIITKEKAPSHQGGMESAEYSFDSSFFLRKYVVLFDDVVTKGHSITWFKNKLESFGAIVICAISIGRTYSDYYGNDREPHPWSGIL